jgi:uncharacterized ferritin-like protein (DUF455 family)
LVGTPDTPPDATVERWAWDLITSTSLAAKLAPPAVPSAWERDPPMRRVPAPGRPCELRVIAKARARGRSLSSAQGRARALHTFLHHELQAAELMSWALLAFPTSPAELRRGLLRIAGDEVRHMQLYAAHLERLGYAYGSFPVRDWFWERVPSCADVVSFVATMGLGFEAANLEHARAFAARFRTAGDEDGARIQELVGREEEAHVRFGARWFGALTGGLTFQAWASALPHPLSPMLMRGAVIDRDARLRAGFSEPFLDDLEAWQPGS